MSAAPSPSEVAAWREAAAHPRIATLADLEPCVRVLSAAFAEDPVTVWYLRADRWKAWALRRQFEGILGGWVLELGHTWIAADGGACAVFLPPDDDPQRRGLLEWPWLLRRLRPNTGWLRLPRAVRLIATMEAHHPATPPHYYVWFLGVDPARQGHGLGEALMRAVLARYDTEGVPSYLENSNPRNTRLYERLGYVTREAYRPLWGGPELVGMWRECLMPTQLGCTSTTSLHQT
ncbi:MAG TPA: GNAT family N-acetyltransferase [bacterium]